MNPVLASALTAAVLCSAQTQTPAPGSSRMEIALEKREAKGARIVDPGHIFKPGDLLRFRFKTNFPGYLYVMNRSTSGKYTLLFPKDETGQSNHIERSTEYLLPATEDGWFRVEGPAGHEVVYWLMSPAGLSRAGGLEIPRIPPLPSVKPEDFPPGATPRCNDTVFRARGDCVDTAAGAKPVAKGETLPGNLSQVSGAGDRDLLFMRKQNLSMVAAPGALDGPVLYEFHVAHK